jgi:hypothetical protein
LITGWSRRDSGCWRRRWFGTLDQKRAKGDHSSQGSSSTGQEPTSYPRPGAGLDQPIAGARHRLYLEPAASGRKLAQHGNGAVDHVISDDAAVPAQIDQLIAGNNLTSVARKSNEHLEVCGRSRSECSPNVASRRQGRRCSADTERRLDTKIDALRQTSAQRPFCPPSRHYHEAPTFDAMKSQE